MLSDLATAGIYFIATYLGCPPFAIFRFIRAAPCTTVAMQANPQYTTTAVATASAEALAVIARIRQLRIMATILAAFNVASGLLFVMRVCLHARRVQSKAKTRRRLSDSVRNEPKGNLVIEGGVLENAFGDFASEKTRFLPLHAAEVFMVMLGLAAVVQGSIFLAVIIVGLRIPPDQGKCQLLHQLTWFGESIPFFKDSSA